MPGIPQSGLLFNFDARDLDGNGVVDVPASQSEAVTAWTDASTAQRAATNEGTGITRDSGQDVVTGVSFAGTDAIIAIPDANELNIQGNITARSFAFLVTTGTDISGTQVIYEQGGNIRGYSLVIAPDFLGRPSLMAFVWNEREWAAGDQHRVINLGQVSTEQTYSVAFVHDASSANFADRTFKAYVDGTQVGSLAGVDIQQAHGGDIALGGINDNTVDPVSFQDTNKSANNDFEGTIHAALSWDRALTLSEAEDIDTALKADFNVPTSPPPGDGGSSDPGGTPIPQTEDVTGNLPTSNIVFRFDSRDLDGNGLRDTGIDGGEAIPQWIDNGGYVHVARTDGTGDATLMVNGNGDVVVDFSDTDRAMTIPNRTGINTAATYNQKTFAFVFETGMDISGTQVIFEQGGGTRGYNLVIDNGRLYAYVWNNAEWQAGHQYKAIDMGAVTANTAYSTLFVHDARGNSLAERTFSAFLNGDEVETLTHVDVQLAHAGLVGLGGIVNVTVRPTNNATIDGIAYNFKGSILSAASWNEALDAQERATVIQDHGNDFGISVSGSGATVQLGTTSNDLLYGTVGAEAIDGLAGSDTVWAAAGDDTVSGSDGNDFLFAAEGNDSVLGGSGADEIQGGDDNDTIMGDGGSDTIGGGNGDDRILPGSGQDLIDGGAGTDVVVVTGNRADYTLTDTGNGFFRLTETATSETDTLLSVESIEFADQTEALASVAATTADFDRDNDLLWSNPSNGYVFVARDGDINDRYGLGINATRQIEGIGDFNGDGVDDILFRNANNGYTYYAPGGDASQAEGLGGQVGREILAVGDFTGDGSDDVLLRDQSNGFTFILDDARPEAMIGLGIQNNRSLLATADFDGDGSTDLLMQDTGNGYTYIIFDGTISNQRGLGIQSNREILAIADFDGNGASDILFRDTGNGFTFIAEGGNVSNTSGLGIRSGFDLEGVGDFDGDNGADLVWRKTDNDYVFWMDGSDATSQVGMGQQAEREILAIADLTNDGQDDVVFRDTNSGFTFFADDGNIQAITGLGTHAGASFLTVFDAENDGAADLLFREDTGGYTYFIAGGNANQSTGVGNQGGSVLLGTVDPTNTGVDSASLIF